MKLSIAIILAVLPCLAAATPQFARELDMLCESCHSFVPKLNAFGEEFAAGGYRLPDLQKARNTLPFGVWMSGLSQNRSDRAHSFKTIPGRIEIISGGRIESAKLTWFAEWRVLSREVLADGSTRDRSGRFEDLFLAHDLTDQVTVQLGQFRALSQIDVSRRLNLSEPLVFSTALEGKTHPDSRTRSLRGFSPSGRSPAVRASFRKGPWNAVATVPFPGEWSIPLTSEAKSTARMQSEHRPKGVFVEAFHKDGVNSLGAHAFVGDNDRRFYGLALARKCGATFWEAGIARAQVGAKRDWRYSVGVDWLASDCLATGVRLDHRQVSGETPILSPYVSLLKTGNGHAVKLLAEARFQSKRTPRFGIELSWMF